MKSGFNLLLSILLIIVTTSCDKNLIATTPFNKNHIPNITGYLEDSISLSAFSIAQKRIYFHFSNSTIYSEFNVKDEVTQKFKTRGFTVQEKPENAPILLSANIKYYGPIQGPAENDLKMKKPNDEKNRSTKESTIGDFLTITAGGVGGFILFNSVSVAFLSGAVFFGGSKLLKEILKKNPMIAIVEIVVSERADLEVQTYDFREVKLGSGGTRKEEFSEKVGFKSYNSRIIIINDDPSESIKQQLISSIVGII